MNTSRQKIIIIGISIISFPVPKLLSNSYSMNIILSHFKKLITCKTIYQKSNHITRESEPQKIPFLIRRFKSKSSGIL
jgi:hypothetical protein